MFLLDNCLYDNPENNPDGTAFEFPEGSQAISVDDEEYLKSLSMEDILNGNIREEWKEIVQAPQKDAIKEYEEFKLNNQKKIKT